MLAPAWLFLENNIGDVGNSDSLRIRHCRYLTESKQLFTHKCKFHQCVCVLVHTGETAVKYKYSIRDLLHELENAFRQLSIIRFVQYFVYKKKAFDPL